MEVPLNRAKADLFRTLSHPVRVRVLELLDDGPKTVRQLLDDIEIEPSRLSQQLAVLRGAGIVISHRVGGSVEYSLSSLDIADLLDAARQVLARVQHTRRLLVAELRRERIS